MQTVEHLRRGEQPFIPLWRRADRAAGPVGDL